MAGNPHTRALALRRRHRAAQEGLGPRVARGGAALLALMLLVPLVQPVFLHFLGSRGVALTEGLGGVQFRASVVLVSVLALDVYTALVRSPDRGVLALLPVDPSQVVQAELRRVALDRIWLVLALQILLAPIAFAGHWQAWLFGGVQLLGAAALGVLASGMVHLLAIGAAKNEALSGLLDLVRGQNPREQAAFIYAPGVVLGGAGILLMQSAFAAPRLASAPVAMDVVWLLLPFAVAGYCATTLSGLAHRAWFDASAVIADIDARSAMLVHEEDARSVYLDWGVRFLPRSWGPWALNDLRHGWRAHRSWITGAWVAGVASGLAAWTSDPAAPGRALAVMAAGSALCATVGVQLNRQEPEFLRAWLPDGGAARRGARLAVLVGWLQPVVWLPVASLLVRHGAPSAVGVLLVGEGMLLGFAAVALVSSALRERALWVYGPGATVLAATVAVLVLRTGGAA